MATEKNYITEERCRLQEGLFMEKLDEIRDDIKSVKCSVEDFHDRLFVDNGRKSFQTRLTNLEWSFKLAVAIASIVLAAVATNYARKMLVPPTTLIVQDGHTIDKVKNYEEN